MVLEWNLKETDHLVISVDAEKAFQKIQYLFAIKVPKKAITEGLCLTVTHTEGGKIARNLLPNERN